MDTYSGQYLRDDVESDRDRISEVMNGKRSNKLLQAFACIVNLPIAPHICGVILGFVVLVNFLFLPYRYAFRITSKKKSHNKVQEKDPTTT